MHHAAEWLVQRIVFSHHCLDIVHQRFPRIEMACDGGQCLGPLLLADAPFFEKRQQPLSRPLDQAISRSRGVFGDLIQGGQRSLADDKCFLNTLFLGRGVRPLQFRNRVQGLLIFHEVIEQRFRFDSQPGSQNVHPFDSRRMQPKCGASDFFPTDLRFRWVSTAPRFHLDQSIRSCRIENITKKQKTK